MDLCLNWQKYFSDKFEDKKNPTYLSNYILYSGLIIVLHFTWKDSVGIRDKAGGRSQDIMYNGTNQTLGKIIYMCTHRGLINISLILEKQKQCFGTIDGTRKNPCLICTM